MIKLAVIDSHVDGASNQLHRLDSLGPIQIVNSVPFTTERLDQIGEGEKLVIVFNLNLEGKPGVELLRHLRLSQAKVCLLLTADGRESEVHAKTLAGADWILINDHVHNTLISEIEQVLSDGKPLNTKVAGRVLRYITTPKVKHWENIALLSAREMEVLNLVSTGALNKEIAEELGLSLQTVKNHLKRIYRKLEVANRSEAVIRYLSWV